MPRVSSTWARAEIGRGRASTDPFPLHLGAVFEKANVTSRAAGVEGKKRDCAYPYRADLDRLEVRTELVRPSR